MSVVVEPNQAALMGRERYEPRSRNRDSVTTYVSVTPDRVAWQRCFESLRAMRSYGHDWNDEGADPPKPEVIGLATTMAKWLRSNFEPAPTRSFATDEGSIILAWEDNGAYFELEVDELLQCLARQLLPGGKRATSAVLDVSFMSF